MAKFLKKLILLLLPLLILGGLYLYLDPFKVLRSYHNYYPEGNFMVYNRDHIATEKYFTNKEKYGYDSFIFGSSRTIGFKTTDWKPLLPTGSSPFLYDASTESIYGIWRKIKTIDSNKGLLNNALLIFDTGTTFHTDVNSEGHLYRKHPYLSHEPVLYYHTNFFAAFVNQGFFVKYFDFLIFKKQRPYMEGFLEFRKITGDTITNDEYIVDQEEELNADSVAYFKKRADIFYDRDLNDSVYHERSITPRQIQMMKEIKEVFDRNKTDYKIVISPLYNMEFFNRKDLTTLQDIFGPDRVFDFSGINELTINKYNYYESSHYRPRVGKAIMNSIYTADTLKSGN